MKIKLTKIETFREDLVCELCDEIMTPKPYTENMYLNGFHSSFKIGATRKYGCINNHIIHSEIDYPRIIYKEMDYVDANLSIGSRWLSKINNSVLIYTGQFSGGHPVFYDMQADLKKRISIDNLRNNYVLQT